MMHDSRVFIKFVYLERQQKADISIDIYNKNKGNLLRKDEGKYLLDGGLSNKVFRLP